MSRATKRRTRDEWQSLIEELDQSGEGVRSFCGAHGLHPPTLQWWRWRLRGPQVSEATPREAKPSPCSQEAPLTFSEVPLARESAAVDGFELRWSDGLTLRVPADFDAVALRRLLAVLEAAEC